MDISHDGQHLGPGTLRVEDPALLRGAGRFSDDVKRERQAAAVFVRSQQAHARIRGVDVAAARTVPGVVAVLTAADMDGVGNIARPPHISGRGDRPLVVPHRPALAGDRVAHIGEPIALVVAETAAIARDASELVVVDEESLPAVTDATTALADGAPQIWPEAQGNLALDWPGPSSDPAAHTAVDRAMADAAHVVRITVANQRIAGMPLEPRGATAEYDPETGGYTLYAPSQGAHVLKAQLHEIMRVPPEQLRVVSGDVGGAFGLKTPPYPEYAALLAAARQVGRPVHWMSTRSEAFLSDNQARDNRSEATLALDDTGRFLALRVAAVVNLGAYVTSAGAMIATIAFRNCFPGMYDISHVGVSVRLAFSNTLPTGPYRGAGRPEANYVMERLVDAAARRIGADPVDLRRRNLIAPTAMPYHSAVGNVYDSGDFAGVLDTAAGLARIAGFAERRRESERRGRRRGIGVSCFLEHAGGGADEGAVLAVEDDCLVVALGIHAAGQGHATVFRRLAAAHLALPVERVAVHQGDSETPIRGGPSVGSRTAFKAGTAIAEAAGQFVDQARSRAAAVLDADLADVGYEEGYLAVAGTNRRISVFDLAAELARRGETDALTTVAHIRTHNTFPNGCHIAEVEIDPETGAVAVVGYVAVDDCGIVLDETIAEAQVVGGVAQGLGQALLEAIVYDEDGQLLTGSLMDYAVPRAGDVPPVSSQFHPVRCLTNPLGVKGVGEAGTTAAIAAVMNAVADAIPSGETIDMPATPEKVWQACRSSGQSNRPES